MNKRELVSTYLKDTVVDIISVGERERVFHRPVNDFGSLGRRFNNIQSCSSEYTISKGHTLTIFVPSFPVFEIFVELKVFFWSAFWNGTKRTVLVEFCSLNTSEPLGKFTNLFQLSPGFEAVSFIENFPTVQRVSRFCTEKLSVFFNSFGWDPSCVGHGNKRLTCTWSCGMNIEPRTHFGQNHKNVRILDREQSTNSWLRTLFDKMRSYIQSTCSLFCHLRTFMNCNGLDD